MNFLQNVKPNENYVIPWSRPSWGRANKCTIECCQLDNSLQNMIFFKKIILVEEM
jgi:hypothetical protein